MDLLDSDTDEGLDGWGLLAMEAGENYARWAGWTVSRTATTGRSRYAEGDIAVALERLDDDGEVQ